jgi:hypothetical protein
MKTDCWTHKIILFSVKMKSVVAKLRCCDHFEMQQDLSVTRMHTHETIYKLTLNMYP